VLSRYLVWRVRTTGVGSNWARFLEPGLKPEPELGSGFYQRTKTKPESWYFKRTGSTIFGGKKD